MVKIGGRVRIWEGRGGGGRLVGEVPDAGRGGGVGLVVGVEEGDDHRKRTTKLQLELLQIHGSPIVHSRMV